MNFRLYPLTITALLLLCVLPFAGCGDEEEGVQPALAPGSESISSQVNLPWQQVGESQLKILSANTFRTGSGEYVYLVGEVENAGDQNLSNVKIKAMAYNGQGEVFDTREAEALVGVVAPGERAPFSTAMDARDVERYELEVTGEQAQSAPAYQLEIASSSMTEPKSGYVWFEGELSNTGEVAVENMRVIAVLYDQNGNVVEAASQDLAEDLAPGDSAQFKFIANYRDAASHQLLTSAKAVQ